MFRQYSYTSLFIGLILLKPILSGQEPTQEVPDSPELELVQKYFEMSPQELLNLPTHLTTGAAKKWLRTPSATYLLTQEEMMQSGHKYIPEQLRMVPGIMLSHSSSNNWAISTRTFQNNFANMQLVLQDGREIYTPTFGGVFWETADLPLEIVDSIEIIRGPGATLWGSNAVNGVINIQTIDAIEAQNNVVTLAGGNEDYGSFSFRQGGELFGGHYYTWGKWSNNRKWFTDPNSSSDDEHHTELRKVGFRADLPGFGEEGWTLRAEYFDHRTISRFGGQFLWTPPGTYTFLDDFIDTANSHGASVQGNWSGTFAESVLWKLRTYYTHEERMWKNISLLHGMDTFEIDFQLGKKMGRHDLLAGLRHRYHDFSFQNYPVSSTYSTLFGNAAAPIFTFPVEQVSEKINSAFIQDTLTLTDRIYLLAGTKFEDNPTGEHWMPSARIWWNADEQTTYWLAYSKALQLPGYNSRYATTTSGYAQVGPSAYVPLGLSSNPNSQPIELKQWELGWRHLFSESLSLDIATFWGEYNDLTLTGEHGLTQTHHNTDTAETIGGEVSLTWHPNEHLRIRSSISTADTDIEGPGSISQQYSKAKWRGNFRANYTPNEHWSYHLGLYGSDRAFPEVPQYIRTDIGTTWTPDEKWEISAYMQNLFDPSHPEDYSPSHGSTIQEVPRSAYLQIRRWF